MYEQKEKGEKEMTRPKLHVTAKITDRRLSMHPADAKKAFSKVADNLSSSEINALNRTGGIHINVRKIPGKNVARYDGIKEGKHHFLIDPASLNDEEVITHEAIHSLQETTGRGNRPKIDSKLSIKRPLSVDDLSLKEALTEAETIARVKHIDLNNTPYYDDIKEQCDTSGKGNCKTPRTMKKEDRNTLTDGTDRPLGKRSVAAVHQKFDRLNIAQYRERGGKRTAKQHHRKYENSDCD